MFQGEDSVQPWAGPGRPSAGVESETRVPDLFLAASPKGLDLIAALGERERNRALFMFRFVVVDVVADEETAPFPFQS